MNFVDSVNVKNEKIKKKQKKNVETSPPSPSNIILVSRGISVLGDAGGRVLNVFLLSFRFVFQSIAPRH